MAQGALVLSAASGLHIWKSHMVFRYLLAKHEFYSSGPNLLFVAKGQVSFYFADPFLLVVCPCTYVGKA